MQPQQVYSALPEQTAPTLPSWRDDPRAQDPTQTFSMERGWEKVQPPGTPAAPAAQGGLPSWKDDPRASDPNWNFDVNNGWQKSWRADPRANDPSWHFDTTSGWSEVSPTKLLNDNLAKIFSQPVNNTPTDTSGSANALQAYLGALQGQQNPLDILTAREQALGIPGAQQQVSGLRQAITNTTNLLNKISPAVQGRTANSLVNSAQANRITQNEQAPVQGQLSKLGQDYGLASADLSQLNTQAMNQANLANEGQQQKLSGLQSAFGMANTQQQSAESVRQFNVGQATQKQQFDANLAVQQAQFGLTKKQVDDAQRQFDLTQAEQKRQFDAEQILRQQTLAEQIRSNQANEAAAKSKAASGGNDGLGAALASIFAGGGSTGSGATTTGGATKVTTTPTQQAAFNDVQTRVNNQTDSQLMSDYQATAASAKNGNAVDLAKLQIYRSLKPDLFKAKYSWEQ